MPKTDNIANPATLETETCGRCGGSGQYSYNAMCGSVCFGCAGKGTRYTKRGLVAANYLETLRSKRAADVVVGDQFFVKGIPVPGMQRSQWVRVTESGPDKLNPTMWAIAGKGHGLITSPDTLVRIAQTAEQKVATLAQAVAFQATLTKSGKPRK